MAYSQPSTALKAGVWGGEGASLQVTAGEPATLELSCAHGTIAEPLAIHADGRIEWTGRFVRERPGPEREGAGEGEPATFRGTLDGDTLTLSVQVDGRDVARLTLTHGRRVRVVKCQ
jgi:hypothetical protein